MCFNNPMSFLKLVWSKWMKIAHPIGNFQAQVILSVFYFVIISPLGIFFRFFSDPLSQRIDTKKKSNFVKWEHPKETLKEARKQY